MICWGIFTRFGGIFLVNSNASKQCLSNEGAEIEAEVKIHIVFPMRGAEIDAELKMHELPSNSFSLGND